jgi:hypothetical protein
MARNMMDADSLAGICAAFQWHHVTLRTLGQLLGEQALQACCLLILIFESPKSLIVLCFLWSACA